MSQLFLFKSNCLKKNSKNMRLIHSLRQYSKVYGQLLDQVRENSPIFIQSLLTPKKKILYNLGAPFEVHDLVSMVDLFVVVLVYMRTTNLRM